MMKERGITQGQLAKMLGYRGQTNICETLKRDIKISKFARFADAMGYEVIVRPKRQGRKEEDAIKVEVQEDETD
jgi:hypothetical protein